MCSFDACRFPTPKDDIMLLRDKKGVPITIEVVKLTGIFDYMMKEEGVE